MDLRLLMLLLLIYLQIYFLQLGTANSVFNSSLDVQVAPPSKNQTEAFCPSDWISYPSELKCFKYVANPQTWDEAETHCRGHNGHLAAVTSLQELSFVQKLCGENISGCWVGGRGTNGTVGADWKWSDNTSWNETISLQLPSNSSCPRLSCYNHNLGDFCTLGTNETVSLRAQRCNTSHTFICMLDERTHVTICTATGSTLLFLQL